MPLNEIKCCICGPVKNCGPYLDKVLQNIEKLKLKYPMLITPETNITVKKNLV